MTTLANVRARARILRGALFPRWRAGAEWTIAAMPPEPTRALGRCERGERTIYLEPAVPDLDVLLVHEICHAVSTDEHGKAWQRRMVKAAEDAARAFGPALASRIMADLAAVQSAHPVTAAVVYGAIEDAVRDGTRDGVPPGFERVTEWVAKEYAAVTAEDLARRFRRCRAVYDASVRQRAQHEEQQRLFLDRTAQA